MNLPDEFIEKYTKLLGDEAESFFEGKLQSESINVLFCP